ARAVVEGEGPRVSRLVPDPVPIQPAAPGVEVADRPTLAAGVELVGELTDSAFRDPQWLIERDSHFIQVPELIYRVAEHADGRRTLQEIASLVTASTGWSVTADHIREIVATKLIPVGIVTPALEGGVALPIARPPALSPLQLRMRREVLGPRTIEPITNVLQLLYKPLFLVPLLIAIGITHGWLYFQHGLVASMRDIVYTPGALAAVLAFVLASVIWHEFGHASALRSGGGRARRIGFGHLLIFSAFYTDTTDAYRLGRWARVRTDLGGFYFQLIFTVPTVVLYFATRQEGPVPVGLGIHS